MYSLAVCTKQDHGFIYVSFHLTYPCDLLIICKELQSLLCVWHKKDIGFSLYEVPCQEKLALKGGWRDLRHYLLVMVTTGKWRRAWVNRAARRANQSVAKRKGKEEQQRLLPGCGDDRLMG